MTKPQALLARANNALQDQTSDIAVSDVAGFIQPVFDVMTLDDRLRTLGFTHVMVGTEILEFRHGPVPRAEIWTYTEMSLRTGSAPIEWHQAIEYTLSGDASAREIHIQNILVGANIVHPASLLRNLESLGAANGGYSSDRSLRLWPGQTMLLASNVDIAAAQTIRFDFNYRVSDSPQNLFESNDNSNVAVVEV